MNQVTIKNDCISITVLEYGAIIKKILVPDNKGQLTNIVVGYKNPEAYLKDTIFLGACVGRYAGRISGGSFELNGQCYPIHHVEGVHLHGGLEGFGKKYWSIDEVNHGKEPYICLSYTSAALEEGYPGELKVNLEYRLIGKALHISHLATTDEPTVINLTNHSYFRLDQEPGIGHYILQLKSNAIVETHNNLLPTGNILPVKDLQYDFRNPKVIGTIPLDTPYVLDKDPGFVSRVYSPVSGIAINVSTNQPALVVYRPEDFPAICFETQNFPDAPNQTHFPSALLNPGETYNNTAIFEFDLVI